MLHLFSRGDREVFGIDIPEGDGLLLLPQCTDLGPGQFAFRRSKQRNADARQILNQLPALADFRLQCQRPETARLVMEPGMVSDLMPFRVNAADELRMLQRLPPDHKERGPDVVRGELIQQPGSLFGMRSVIECQRNGRTAARSGLNPVRASLPVAESESRQALYKSHRCRSARSGSRSVECPLSRIPVEQ